MKGVITNENGELMLTIFAEVKINSHEVLIDVHAAAVNRLDILQRKNLSGYVENPVLGVEVAGVIENPNGHPDI